MLKLQRTLRKKLMMNTGLICMCTDLFKNSVSRAFLMLVLNSFQYFSGRILNTFIFAENVGFWITFQLPYLDKEEMAVNQLLMSMVSGSGSKEIMQG